MMPLLTKLSRRIKVLNKLGSIRPAEEISALTSTQQLVIQNAITTSSVSDRNNSRRNFIIRDIVNDFNSNFKEYQSMLSSKQLRRFVM